MKSLFACLLASVSMAGAQSTLDPAKAYAWSANAGWLYLRPTAGDGVAVHLYHLSGKGYGANFGWVDFGDGTPGAGHLYSNAAASDFGVNHDGAGNLFGDAWSANAGWIHFGWAAANDPDRPRFDLLTGLFQGYAWSANLGWINLGPGSLQTRSLAITDSDHDGIGDEWELAWFGTLTAANAVTDADGDGTSDKNEYLADTGPLDTEDHLNLKLAALVRGAEHVTTLSWKSKATRLYRLQTSPSLLSSSWTETTPGPIPGTGDPILRVLTSLDLRRFYRLEARLPFQPGP